MHDSGVVVEERQEMFVGGIIMTCLFYFNPDADTDFAHSGRPALTIIPGLSQAQLDLKHNHGKMSGRAPGPQNSSHSLSSSAIFDHASLG